MWPSFPFDLLFWLLITVGAVRRYLDDQSEEVIYHIYGVLSLFLIGPWIIRRTVRLNFPDFHLVAIRQPGGEETRAISYRESLNVAWLLAWRSGLVVGLVYGAIFLALWALRGAPPSGFQRPAVSGVLGFIQLVVGNLLCLLLFYLWLVSAAIRKTYSDFVLQLRETSQVSR
jgi:hypothetical protein